MTPNPKSLTLSPMPCPGAEANCISPQEHPGASAFGSASEWSSLSAFVQLNLEVPIQQLVPCIFLIVSEVQQIENKLTH